MRISYSPTFKKSFERLPEQLQEEILEKIELFKDEKNHQMLKVHKLSGRLDGRYSFSVNYKTRIVFFFPPVKPREAYLFDVGDHSVYDR